MGATFQGYSHTFGFKLLVQVEIYLSYTILTLYIFVFNRMGKKKTDSYLPRHGDGLHNQVNSQHTLTVGPYLKFKTYMYLDYYFSPVNAHERQKFSTTLC